MLPINSQVGKFFDMQIYARQQNSIFDFNFAWNAPELGQSGEHVLLLAFEAKALRLLDKFVLFGVNLHLA